MINPCRRIPFWAATVLSFGVLVMANVLLNGIRPPTSLGVGVAAAGIVLFALLIRGRIQRFRSLDEMHQRVELESFAAAFAGSFMVFAAYWLLEIAQVLPPLNGMYYVLVMIGLVSSGTDSAWQRLVRGHPGV